MKLLVICGKSGEPYLMADILTARRSTFDGNPAVLIETATDNEEYFEPYGFEKQEALNQCDMFIRFVAQEMSNRSVLAEVDEKAGFCYGEDETIIALSRTD